MLRQRELRIFCGACLAIAVVFVRGLYSPALRAETSTTCPAADPYDSTGDSAALQDCLDNYDVVELEPAGGEGYVGYIVDDGIHIRNLEREYAPNIKTLYDAEYGKAVLIAHPDLDHAMISADDDPNGYELHQIIIDGNRYNRTLTDSCVDGLRNWGSNMVLSGSDFKLIGVESFRALCGSGAAISGDYWEVAGSGFYDNGTAVADADEDTAPWADGLTANRCTGGYIHDNALSNNSDVDLLVAEGEDCEVARNEITHDFKQGIVGMQLRGEDGYGRGVFDNSVVSDEDLLQVGIMIGMHPFGASPETNSDTGYIYDNYSSGCVTNMIIDGIDDGQVYDNTFDNEQGSRSFNGCSVLVDYTAGHFGSATIQSGYTSFVFDPGNCGS